jgi:hypothetical protein
VVLLEKRGVESIKFLTFSRKFLSQQTFWTGVRIPFVLLSLRLVKKVISISLALLMLVSNVGFTLNTHFCGGEAVETSFSIGLHNPDCGMPDMDRDCETIPSTEEQVKSKPCCENQHQLIQLDENADLQAFSTEVNPTFFVAFVHSFVQPILFADQAFVHNTYYSPPIPDKDIQVLFQTFLI